MDGEFEDYFKRQNIYMASIEHGCFMLMFKHVKI